MANHPSICDTTLTCLWFVLCQVLGCLHKNFIHVLSFSVYTLELPCVP